MKEYFERLKLKLEHRELVFALVHFLTVTIVGLAVPVYSYFRGSPELSVVARYMYSFWKQHYWHLTLIVLYSSLLLFLSTMVRETYIKGDSFPSPHRRAIHRKARTHAFWINMISIPAYFTGYTFVWQRVPWVITYSFLFIIVLAYLVVCVQSQKDHVPRLGKFQFQTISFNVAALAPLSEEVKLKLREFQQTRMVGGISSQSGSILNSAKSDVFKGLQRLLRFPSPSYLRLAFNTTSAVRIAIEEIKQYCLQAHSKLPIIITTDSDYPAVIGLVEGNSKKITVGADESVEDALNRESNDAYDMALRRFKDSLADERDKVVRDAYEELYRRARELEPMPLSLSYKISVEQELVQDRLSSRELVRRIVDVIAASVCADRPALVVTGHVHWQTGFILDIEEFSNQIADKNKVLGPEFQIVLNKNCFLVFDGAQAVGHIEVGGGDDGVHDLWSRITFYAGCTHKWLLGKETMGFLVRGSGAEHIPSLPSDGSMFSYEDEFYAGYGGTINVESFVGASVSLQEFQELDMKEVVEHNMKLVSLFKSGLHSVDGLSPRDELGSSMVLVRCGHELAEDFVREYEVRRGSVVSMVTLRDESGIPQRALRFCFHYFHSEKDVLDLVDEVESIMTRIRRNAR